eukprot:gene4300-4869_t
MENNLSKVGSILAKCTDHLIKTHKEVDVTGGLKLDELVSFHTDAIALLGTAQLELSLQRRDAIFNRTLKKEYAGLHLQNVPITSLLLGDDLQPQLKNIKASNNLTQSVSNGHVNGNLLDTRIAQLWQRNTTTAFCQHCGHGEFVFILTYPLFPIIFSKMKWEEVANGGNERSAGAGLKDSVRSVSSTEDAIPKRGTIKDVWKGTPAPCIVCNVGKMCQTRNQKPDERAKGPVEFVQCDLASPIDPKAKDVFMDALCFVDNFTGIHIVEATKMFLADMAPFGEVK